MSYQYIATPFDFRLLAWPYSSGRYVTTYNTDKYLIDIRPILDYLDAALRKINVAFVLKTAFTLINVHNGMTKYSMGLTPEPDESVRRTNLSFTFARTHRDDFGKPKFRFWQNMYTCIWGDSDTSINDFYTISIPLSVIVQCRVPLMMRPEMNRLYDVTGGYTRSIIRSIKPFTGGVETHRKFLYFTIPRAMQHVAMQDWCYVIDFWRRMPDLLTVDWNPTFLEYYCRYIAERMPERQRSPHYAKYKEELEDHLRQFILRYLQGTVKPEEAGLVALLPAEENEIHDVETLVYNLSRGIIS